jgi:tetratricopeptide (TPR) repeat protein
LIGANLEAQTIFRGKILDVNTQAPIEGVKVGISDQGVGVVTNANGSFSYRKYNQTVGNKSELKITAKGYEDLVLSTSQIRAFYNKSSKFALTPTNDVVAPFDFAKQKKVVIYWDASLSSTNRNFKKEWSFIEAYINEFESLGVTVIIFNDKVISQKEFAISKNSAPLKAYLENITYEGATSYEILPSLEVDAVLLFSDGNPVLGEWQGTRDTPLYGITSQLRANKSYLKSLALFTSGSYVNLSQMSASQALEQIKSGVPFLQEAAQDNTMVSGRVTTTSGPIQEASITIKGDLEEYFTKADGSFTIPAQKGDVLQVRYLGMYPKEMLVQDQSNLKIAMIPIDQVLDEVILEGKGRKEKKQMDSGFGEKNEDAVGISINTITSQDIRPNAQYLGDIVRGRFAGVTVNGFGSEAVFTIRGGNTSMPAIWVVDGAIYNEPPIFVDPQNVHSISIVKSIQATARYGTVATGGAFIVKTKGFAFQENDGEIVDQALVKGNDYNEQTAQINLEALKPNYVKQVEALEGREEQFKLYTNLAKANTTNATFFIDMALFFEKAYPEKAVEVRSRLAEIAQGNSKVLRVLAYLYENAREYENALKTYERVALLAPGEAQSYRDLANAHKEAGNYDKSLELYINMLSEQIRGVNFKHIDKALGHELLHLVARHKDQINYERLPEEWLLNQYRLDLRMVIEWSDREAPFEFQFVNPQDKYFKWNHTLIENKERLEQEVKSGYQFEEFVIDEAPHGLWIVNIEYLGEDRYTIIPPYLKYTIYRDYGTSEERKETIIIKLTKDIGKAKLHEFLL